MSTSQRTNSQPSLSTAAPARFPSAYLDDLLADHEVRASVDGTIYTVRALGLQVRPDVLREQAAANEVEADRAELTIALIARRLSTLSSMV